METEGEFLVEFFGFFLMDVAVFFLFESDFGDFSFVDFWVFIEIKIARLNSVHFLAASDVIVGFFVFDGGVIGIIEIFFADETVIDRIGIIINNFVVFTFNEAIVGEEIADDAFFFGQIDVDAAVF